MRNVYLVQVNNRFGNAAFLPYSVGLLQAYAQRDVFIAAHYRFAGFQIFRDDVDVMAEHYADADVVAFSCYIWNYEYNRALAAAIRKANPEVLLIAGGPHILENTKTWTHPDFDVVVHHEGEQAFREVLRWNLQWRHRVGDDPYGDSTFLEAALAGLERTKNLDDLPSPYLDGVFDEMIEMNPHVEWVMSQETNRGCPYSCTFCDWGSAVFQKVRKFDAQRVKDELQWAAEKGIELLYNCDANFGIFERDEEFVDEMVLLKDISGFPKQFRAAYAKNSNQRVFDIAKKLNDAGMNKGVTLSFQSLDAPTLINIKRKNMKMNDFQGLIKQYTDAGIATYSEIILGLPGETYDTFVDGICTVLAAGQHDSINIYPCMVLPNAEMNDPEYRRIHGIETRIIPDLATHSVPSDDPHVEKKEIVVATTTMPLEDWRRAYTFGCVVQALHSMGLTQDFARKVVAEGRTYRYIYETIIADIPELAEIPTAATQRVLDHGCWDAVLPTWGPISWTPEEALFLRYASAAEHVRLLHRLTFDAQFVLSTFESVRHSDDKEFASPEDYAREVVWYGRKASKWRR